MTLTEDELIERTRCWIDRFVVRMNLCPFARRPLAAEQVRFVVCSSSSLETILQALAAELFLLENDSSIETTLLILPAALASFEDYNAFLDLCDGLLRETGLDGVFQIASFHPRYRFADTPDDAPENYSNRSPFPMLHLLREASVARAVAEHPAIDSVPVENIAALRSLGEDELRALWQSCVDG